jgi:hypothetical protein
MIIVMMFNATFNNISAISWDELALSNNNSSQTQIEAVVVVIMVVGFTTTYMQSVAITTKVGSLNPTHG